MTNESEKTKYKHFLINKTNDIITKQILDGVHNFSNEYVNINNIQFMYDNIYMDKLYDIIKLFSNEQISKHLLFLIESNQVLPEKIAFMKDHELNPDKYEKIIQNQKEQNKPKKGSTEFKCKKCGNNNTEVVLKQIRRGDEPPTIFITCLECGYSFRKD